MTRQERDEVYLLAGEYVLGVLPAAQAALVAVQVAHLPELRAAVGYWESRLEDLASLARPLMPDAALWTRVERSLFAGAAVVSVPRPRADAAPAGRSGLWNRLAFWQALAATGFAAALVLAFLAFGLPGSAPAPSFTVALQSPADRSVGWIVESDAAGRVRLVPLARTEVPPGRALQFWTKADDWKGPESLGLVPADRAVRVSAAHLPPVRANQLFEITLEPAQGSPIGRPTGPVLFIGRAVKVE
jgi:anti-sigma-K factor RskA